MSSTPFYVSVCDFGAVGDGITDDTLAIQTAINTAAAANTCVFVPDGKYLTSSTLTLPKGFNGQICLAGMTAQSSILLFTGTGNGLDFDLSTSPTYVFLNGVEISNLSILSIAPSPAGVPIKINYGVTNGTGAETNIGCILKNLCIGTVLTGNYVQQVPNAGWSDGITLIACHNLNIDNIYSYGSGGNQFPNRGAGSGSMFNLASCVNANFSNIGTSSWANVFNFLNAGNGLSDCQGISMRSIRGVTCGQLMKGIGTVGDFPNGLSAITLIDWMLDDGFGGGAYATGPVISLSNAAQVVISAGWCQLANGGPFAWFTHCNEVKVTNNHFYLGGGGNQIGVFIDGGGDSNLIQGNYICVPAGMATYVNTGATKTTIAMNSFGGSRVGITDLGTATISSLNQL